MGIDYRGMPLSKLRRKGPRKRQTKLETAEPCPYCSRPATYFHRCRHCDFYICQLCAKDNDKIFSCNNMTWPCPACGKSNSL